VTSAYVGQGRGIASYMADIVPASGAYLEQILRESFSIWGEGLSFPRYVKYWEAQLRTPWGAAHLDRVALVEHDSVTSSAKRYDLSARIDGRIRRVLGIGAVFTSPSRRGQGGARRLLESMIEGAVAEGYEFAMLFSEIDPAFYKALDFVPIPFWESHLRVTRGKGSPMVLVRAGDDRDIPAIADLTAAHARNARLALDRSDDWIRFGITKRRLLGGLGPADARQVEFLVTEEAHRAVAYIVTTVHDGRWFIEDAGDRDPSGARLGAMLQAMLARTPHLEQPDIAAWLPHGFVPPQVEVVVAQPAEVLMLRPLQDRTLPLPPLAAEDVVYWRSDYF
jgi:predicted N-acetyltransferase YhbS